MQRYFLWLLVEIGWLYLVAALFGISLFGIILVETPHIPWLLGAAGLASWVLWRALCKVIVFSVFSGVVHEALRELVLENKNGQA